MGEKILIDIDDGGALEQYISRIESALGRTPGGGTTRGTPRTSPKRMHFAAFWDRIELDYAARSSLGTQTTKSFSDTLMGASFSREERIIARAAGGSGALRGFYNVKRARRAVNEGGYVALTSAIAIGILLIDQIQRTRRYLIAQNETYKNLFLEYKPDLTLEEFNSVRDEGLQRWEKLTNWIFGVK